MVVFSKTFRNNESIEPLKKKNSAAPAAVSDAVSDEHPNDNLPLVSDRVLIENLPELTVTRGLIVSAGRAQLAQRLLEQQPDAKLSAWYIDLHQAERAQSTLPAAVEVVCSADLPPGDIDLAALAISKRGEAELTRELLQQSHERLIVGGVLAHRSITRAIHGCANSSSHVRQSHLHRCRERASVYWSQDRPAENVRATFKPKLSFAMTSG